MYLLNWFIYLYNNNRAKLVEVVGYFLILFIYGYDGDYT